MALSGLAQIDENSSFVHAHSHQPLLLPTLLSRGPQLQDLPGDKTPELWPKIASPRASGIRSNAGFALGDETPECWPEFAPSFRMDIEHPASAEQATHATQATASGSLAPMQQLPLWPGQVAFPLGMIFGAQQMSIASLEIVSMMGAGAPLLAPTASTQVEIERTSKKSVQAEPSPGKIGKTKAAGNITSKKSKAVRAADVASDAEDVVPVAIFVDLSTLRERRCLAK